MVAVSVTVRSAFSDTLLFPTTSLMWRGGLQTRIISSRSNLGLQHHNANFRHLLRLLFAMLTPCALDSARYKAYVAICGPGGCPDEV